MTKTLRLLLVLVGGLLFVVGVLVGQQVRHSKFEKYLRPATSNPMDVAVVEANLHVIRSFMQLDVPVLFYDSSCGCFIAHSVVTSELTKQPLDEVRRALMVNAILARRALEMRFPELSKSGTVPDRDFKMTFYELDTGNPSASHDLAEYVDGKIVFK
jgi:uncharacterized protein YneF (UPF0154 family)